MELVGGGSDINGATPSSFSVSVLLLASVERFGVPRMQDFLLSNCIFLITLQAKLNGVGPVYNTPSTD